MNSFHPKELVIFDVETTGLSPSYGDRVIELAALKVALPVNPVDATGRLAYDIRKIKRVATFATLIHVPREISYGAFAVNGITSEMLAQAPRPRDVYPDFMEFIQGCCLVGHNVRFDIKFLRSELDILNLPWIDGALTSIDTVKMARSLLPGLGRYSLWSVSRFLGIDDVQHHRALADVELTFKVFMNLLAIAERRDICEIDSLIELAGKKFMIET